MTADMQIERLPVDGFCPKFDRNLQIMFKDHMPNFIPVALIVFELLCSQTDIIPKLCFSDSGSQANPGSNDYQKIFRQRIKFKDMRSDLNAYRFLLLLAQGQSPIILPRAQIATSTHALGESD
ncbi:hypothetical protein AVEN_45301-1 [Araneus ventricosus]|uniref:Uncharacterized protein n=1 Tax=Araneus ventricosus TaxID=182803 RepID=A0A4Y2MT75_ARAVE|nr:hypothetical protein AVEN_45301-1 [Araneus ventricosus]